MLSSILNTFLQKKQVLDRNLIHKGPFPELPGLDVSLLIWSHSTLHFTFVALVRNILLCVNFPI